MNSSYGHYTGAFVEGISAAAAAVHQLTAVLSLPKCLRELVRKFMLSDLELAIVGHVCGLCGWNYNQPLLARRASELLGGQEDSQHPATPQLMLLLELAGYFVKQYLGLEDEALAVAEFKQCESGGRWAELYEEWLLECPREMFTLSPRRVNRLYSEMSRDCQQRPHAKDYNHMVDQILELSTTYSMIPAEHKAQEKGKKRARRELREEEEEEARRGKEPRRIRNSIITGSNMWLRGDSKREESRLESHNWMAAVGGPPLNPANAVSTISNTDPSKRRISLSSKNKQQTVTQHVNDFFSLEKKPSVRELTPRQPSNIGFRSDSFANLFNFNSVSDRIEPIPYNLRSSDMDVSKL